MGEIHIYRKHEVQNNIESISREIIGSKEFNYAVPFKNIDQWSFEDFNLIK